MHVGTILKKPTTCIFLFLIFLSTAAPAAAPASGFPKTRLATLSQLIDDGWLEEARDKLLPLVDQYPKDAFLRYELARAGLWLGDFDLADKQSRKCTDLVDDNLDFQILRGHALGSLAQSGPKIKALSRARGCRKAYEKAVRIDPDNIDARESLMVFHLMAPGIVGGKTRKAREQAEAINKIDPMRGHFARAQILQHLDHDPAGARGEYMAAIDHFGQDSEPCYEFARFLDQQKEKDEAVRYFEMGVAKDDNPGDALLALARLLSSQDFPAQAIDAYERVLILEPSRIAAKVRMSKVYLETKKFEKSQEILTQTLAENPDCVFALYQEGILLSRLGKDYPKAESNLRRYLDSRLNMEWESRTTALYQLAKVMEKQGQYHEAWELATFASELMPYNKFYKAEAKKMEFMGRED